MGGGRLKASVEGLHRAIVIKAATGSGKNSTALMLSHFTPKHIYQGSGSLSPSPINHAQKRHAPESFDFFLPLQSSRPSVQHHARLIKQTSPPQEGSDQYPSSHSSTSSAGPVHPPHFLGRRALAAGM